MKLNLSFSLVAVLGFGGFASAQVVTLVNGGGVVSTTELTQYATYGSNMSGMVVRARFDNGFQDARTWAVTNASSGGVSGTDGATGSWSLSVSGDTYSSGAWVLNVGQSSSSLRSLTLLGTAGKTVFDRTFDFNEGTSGSAGGKDLSISTPSFVQVQGTYSLAVALTGQAPVGDIFATLDMQFLNTAGLPGGSRMVFSQDADNAKTQIVPEPATILALAAGLAVLRGRQRRQSTP